VRQDIGAELARRAALARDQDDVGIDRRVDREFRERLRDALRIEPSVGESIS
jgi:hypothetical protein